MDSLTTHIVEYQTGIELKFELDFFLKQVECRCRTRTLVHSELFHSYNKQNAQ